MKSKALSLFHLNVGFLPKQFDNFKHLINQLQTEFDFISIAESRLINGITSTTNINLNDYVIEHTPAESSAGGTLLYIKKYLCQPRNDLNIYKSHHLESILFCYFKLFCQKDQILLLVVFTDIHLWIYASSMTITLIFF